MAERNGTMLYRLTMTKRQLNFLMVQIERQEGGFNGRDERRWGAAQEKIVKALGVYDERLQKLVRRGEAAGRGEYSGEELMAIQREIANGEADLNEEMGDDQVSVVFEEEQYALIKHTLTDDKVKYPRHRDATRLVTGFLAALDNPDKLDVTGDGEIVPVEVLEEQRKLKRHQNGKKETKNLGVVSRM